MIGLVQLKLTEQQKVSQHERAVPWIQFAGQRGGLREDFEGISIATIILRDPLSEVLLQNTDFVSLFLQLWNAW